MIISLCRVVGEDNFHAAKRCIVNSFPLLTKTVADVVRVLLVKLNENSLMGAMAMPYPPLRKFPIEIPIGKIPIRNSDNFPIGIVPIGICRAFPIGIFPFPI